MKTVREMFVSLTAMLINHIRVSIIEICVEKWHTQSLKKLKFKCPDMRNGIDLRRCPLLVNHFGTGIVKSNCQIFHKRELSKIETTDSLQAHADIHIYS